MLALSHRSCGRNERLFSDRVLVRAREKVHRHVRAHEPRVSREDVRRYERVQVPDVWGYERAP
jgi:hypothetical protein